MHFRLTIVALAALATLSLPTAARAQAPAPVSPSRLLAQRAALGLTPAQVKELTLLSDQVRRHQEAVLRARSKSWIANTKGTSREVAAERAFRLLTPQQRDLAGVNRPQVID